MLGATRHFWELQLTGNGNLATELNEKVLTALKELRPKMVFTTALTDYHQEHVELSRQLLPIIRGCGRAGIHMPEIYAYDSHDGRDPVELYVDITDVYEKHMESLRCHATFAKKGVYPEGENTLTRVKTGRAMVLGASMPHPTRRALFAEGYRIVWANPTEVSTIRLLFPERFCYRPQTWLTSMWYT